VRAFRRAPEIDAGNDFALGEIGRVYMMCGRPEGREKLEQALAADTLSPIHHAGFITTALLSGRHDVVSHEAQRILRPVPEFAIIRHDLALSLLHQGRDEDALAVLAAAPDERVSTIGGLVNRSPKLAVEGRSAEATTSRNTAASRPAARPAAVPGAAGPDQEQLARIPPDLTLM
jgi:hypothetical protein